MYVSALELYRIGPGPSSSRTVGPQRAALRFVHDLSADGMAARTARVDVHLFGTLACTGRESGTDGAVVAGLSGEAAERSDAESRSARLDRVATAGLPLGGRGAIHFDPDRHLRFHVGQAMVHNGNALRFDAFDAAGAPLASRLYFTGAGGEVQDEREAACAPVDVRVPYPFASGDTLLGACRANGKKIADLARANECALRSPDELRAGLLHVALAMRASIERGIATRGTLPVSGAERRAADLSQALERSPGTESAQCAVYAAAVAEENAAGNCVVAAPTHGAAGPVAALLHHWRATAAITGEDRTVEYLMTAAAVGQSIRAAGLRQAGCQSAVGLGAAMAAAGYAAVLGASPAQALCAAERALEGHFALACDSVAGLVQQPCIERNARGAACALEAAQDALHRPAPRPGLDALVRSMVETARGMAGRYKSDSLAGIARNIADC